MFYILENLVLVISGQHLPSGIVYYMQFVAINNNLYLTKKKKKRTNERRSIWASGQTQNVLDH